MPQRAFIMRIIRDLYHGKPEKSRKDSRISGESVWMMERYNSVTSFVVGTTEELLSTVAKVKEMRKQELLQPVRIRMRGGYYCLAETLVLDQYCSALTFEPFDDHKVVLSGGKKIGGFQNDTYDGMPCFSAFLPEVKEGKFDFSDFYVDEKRAEFTRFPETGYLKPVNWDKTPTAYNAPQTWIIADSKQIAGLSYDEHSYFTFFHKWIDEHATPTNIDFETGRIDFSPQSAQNVGDMLFVFENIPHALKAPNQWYLERESGKVYYIPDNEDQTADSIEAYAPVLEHVVSIEGEQDAAVYGIIFRNICIAHTRGERGVCTKASDGQACARAGAAFELKYAKGCSIENCFITCYGRYGVLASVGCHDILISGCKLTDGGAGGVRIDGAKLGEDVRDYTDHVRVTETIISHCGRRYAAGVGVLIMHASGCEVSHCDISDLYYSGVSAGWTWGYDDNNTAFTRITDNHIWKIGQSLISDMGGVYLLGKQEGTIVSGNLIHDVFARTYGGWALYTDEGSSYVTMENNVCFRTFDYVYHQHYGGQNTIRNNIFAYGGFGITRTTRPEEHLSLTFENCILYAAGRPLYSARCAPFFELGRIVFRDCIGWDEEGTPYCNVTPDPEGGTTIYSLENMRASGTFENMMIINPGFRDPKHDDFSLPDDSPVYKIGFRKIDLSHVGAERNIYKN